MHRTTHALGRAVAAALLTTLALVPTALADHVPVNEQNRRAVYAGLFATAANLHQPLPGGTADRSRRVPASSFSLVAASLAQAYEDAPWLDPDDAAAVFRKVLTASSCAAPCVPAEQSATQMLRRADEVVRDPKVTRELGADAGFVIANAVAQVGAELGRASSQQALKQAIMAMPPEDAAQLAQECSADTAACGTAQNAIFAPWLGGIKLDASPAKLNQTPVLKGGKIGIEILEGVIVGEDGEPSGGTIEGETVTFEIRRSPARLADDGALEFDADAIQPAVTPLEQVPEASAEQLQQLLEEEADCAAGDPPCVSEAEMDAATKLALHDWFDRAIQLVTPDAADPGKTLVPAEGLGWLRQLTLLDGDDEQGPLWDEFRDEAARMQTAISAAVEDVAKAAAAAQLNATNAVTAQATANVASLADGVTGERRAEKNAAFWKAGEDQRKAVPAGVAATNATLDQGKALGGMVASFIATTGNPELAKQVKTVANASVAIAKAATNTVAGIVQLGSQIATGNFIGAAVSSVSLIQDL